MYNILCTVIDTIQYIIHYIQYSTIQYSTLQYSTIHQHRIPCIVFLLFLPWCCVLILFNSECLLHVWPDRDGGKSSQRGTNPVYNEVLHGSMAPASKLKGGGEDWVEVSTCGIEGENNEGCCNEAVNCCGVLGLLHRDQAGTKSTTKSANSFHDGTMKNRDGQVCRAYIIYSGVGATNMSFRNFKSPENLDQSEN